MKASVFLGRSYSKQEADDLRRDLMSRYGSLSVNIKTRAEPGDSYSRLVLGLHNAIRTSRLAVVGDKDAALSIVGSSGIALGLVAASSDAEAVVAFHKVHSELEGVLLIEGEARVHVS